MVLARKQPIAPKSAAYDADFSAWAGEQAALLRQGAFTDLDIANLIEEVESLGREQQHALMSSYRLVMSHLLKWQFQPSHRSRSWSETIGRERLNIEDREEMNPSLAAKIPALLNATYKKAVREAARETGLPVSVFPADCPFTVDQLRDPDFLPA